MAGQRCPATRRKVKDSAAINVFNSGSRGNGLIPFAGADSVSSSALMLLDPVEDFRQLVK